MAFSTNPAAGPKKTSIAPLWIAIVIVLLMWLALPIMMVLGFGMVPTIVAYLIDRSTRKYAAICVGGMNFCGLLDIIWELWAGPNTPGDAMDLLTDPFNLLMVFGAAGFGWLLYMSLPPVVGAVLQVLAEQRMNTCRDIQADLIKKWGEDVAQSALAIVAPAAGEGTEGAAGAEGVDGDPAAAAPPQIEQISAATPPPALTKQALFTGQVFHGALDFFEGTGIDLAHPLARDTIDFAEVLQCRRRVL
jgi:hypothetical protein